MDRQNLQFEGKRLLHPARGINDGVAVDGAPGGDDSAGLDCGPVVEEPLFLSQRIPRPGRSFLGGRLGVRDQVN